MLKIFHLITKKKYPDHKMIDDIGSGVNLNKRGIINLAIAGRINEVETD